MDKKLDALMENEAFVEELKTVETVEQAVALFDREGVKVTADELNKIVEDGQSDNLSEDDLDNVSGGCLIHLGIHIIRGILNSRKRSHGGGGFR